MAPRGYTVIQNVDNVLFTCALRAAGSAKSTVFMSYGIHTNA